MPIKFVGVKTHSEIAIIEIVANGVNNPGNSVFGPKGFICPGNTITSMLMKSVADLKRQFRVEVDGKPTFLDGAGLKAITNPDQVFVTFHERDPTEVEELTVNDHLYNFMKAPTTVED